jgi:hypothetical protein
MTTINAIGSWNPFTLEPFAQLEPPLDSDCAKRVPERINKKKRDTHPSARNATRFAQGGKNLLLRESAGYYIRRQNNP